MPTILRTNGFRFFFYSNENDEPAHVHVEKGNAEGKTWLEPTLSVAYFRGLVARSKMTSWTLLRLIQKAFKKMV
jgi:Domain of unknown function (DUF4160)